MLLRALAFVVLVLAFGVNAQAKELPVDITVTTSEGCQFHIVGTADVTIAIPFRNSTINAFTGTITMSGPGDCPQGEFNVTFGMLSGVPETTPLSPEEMQELHQKLWDDPNIQTEVANHS